MVFARIKHHHPAGVLHRRGRPRELHRRAAGAGYIVRAFFISQTLDQMAAATPLSAATPPSHAPILISGCAAAPPGFDCDYEAFKRAVRTAMDPACVDRALKW